jgi:mRNA interferase RelE/StbE
MNEGWSVRISHRVDKKLSRLTKEDRIRIDEAINNLLDKPEHVDFKLLKGKQKWRLRVGNWRIIFEIEITTRTFVAVEFGPRGDVYKK